MVTLYREHPRIFNRFYKLHQRVEAGWHSLKNIIGKYNEKQNSPNHKNGNLIKNHLPQPHLGDRRKLRILSQNLKSEKFK